MRRIQKRKGLLFSAMILLLSGCGGADTFISFGGKEGGQPVFCISAKPNCAAPGAPLRAFQVDQVDADGQRVRVMWRVEAPPGWGGRGQVASVTYGATPPEWAIVSAPLQLSVGQRYRVNDRSYFSVTNNGLIMVENTVK
ncbi:MAG: hypothetical protein QM667_08535 [Asticcacaulis sp.]